MSSLKQPFYSVVRKYWDTITIKNILINRIQVLPLLNYLRDLRHRIEEFISSISLDMLTEALQEVDFR